MKIKSRWADGRRPCAGSANSATSGFQAGARPAWLTSKLRARLMVEAAAFLVAVAGVAYSAILTKTAGHAPALAVVTPPEQIPGLELVSGVSREEPDAADLADEYEFIPAAPIPAAAEPAPAETAPEAPGHSADTRWFNGRPIRPAGVLRMRVTAYSPDARSCGDSADGITATLHSVETNGFQLVAADPRVLRYGSLITVPGYAGDNVVPVLDCGGKIKGSRLDVLYPTHEEARRWGSKSLPITVWQYADGKPAPNPRKLR